MAPLFRQMTLCGVGLIGGSLALIARRAGLVERIVGLGRTQANLDVALERGIIDSATRDPQARYHIDAQVERLHAFLARLGLGSVHLGGNSMGGFIAAQYAASYPDEVRSLWLIDAAGSRLARDTAIIQHFIATGEMPLLVRSEADYGALLRTTMQHVPVLPYSLRCELAPRG